MTKAKRSHFCILIIVMQTKQILLKRYDFYISTKIYKRLRRRNVVLSTYNRATYLDQTQVKKMWSQVLFAHAIYHTSKHLRMCGRVCVWSHASLEKAWHLNKIAINNLLLHERLLIAVAQVKVDSTSKDLLKIWQIVYSL